MTPHRRKNDPMIDEIRNDVKKVLKILNGNGAIGIVAQTEINKNDITEIKKKPVNIKNWVIALAIIINTVVGAVALIF